MPPKRRYNNSRRRLYKKYGRKVTVDNAARTIQAAIRRQLARNIETKQGSQTNTDGVEIYHNNFVSLNNQILFTSNGPNDPTLNSSDNRIGDQITLRGVKIKMMVELNERYSDVTFRLFVVRSAKGDTPTRATLFNGLSGNKMLDTINKERYTFLFQKYFKIKAPNPGAVSTDGTSSTIVSTVNNAGIFVGNTNQALSRASKIINVWIPGKAFSKSGIITYEGQGSTSQPKFFDYHCLLYAYSNYSTLQDVYYVGRVNDYVQTIYFKDA